MSWSDSCLQTVSDQTIRVIATPFALDHDFRLRFERESLLAAAIEHPSVVPIYQADEVEGRLAVTNLGLGKSSFDYQVQLITTAGKRIGQTAQITGDRQAEPAYTGRAALAITHGATAHLCTIFTLADRDVAGTVVFTPGNRDTATWGLEHRTRTPQPRSGPGDCDAKGITRPPHREGRLHHAGRCQPDQGLPAAPAQEHFPRRPSAQHPSR